MKPLRIGCISLVLFVLTACHSAKRIAPVSEGSSLSIAEGGSINIQRHRYRVHRGDTLYAIAWALGVDYRDLAYVNYLKPPYALHPGQRINVALHARKRYALSSKWAEHKAVSVLFAGGKKKWCWPVRGRIVEPAVRVGRRGENGITIAGHLSAPIRAAASGVVVYSGQGIRGYGNLVIVKHTDELLSAYAYNVKRLVKTGDHVARGQRIALMGYCPSGHPCLHFEIRRGGKPVNPLHYLG